MSVIAFIVLVCLALAGGYCDLTERRIPNVLNIVIFLGGVTVVIVQSDDWIMHAAHCVITLVVGLIFFRFGLWGGGDAKFYSSLALWFPLIQAPFFALSTAACGVLLVGAFWGLRKLRKTKKAEVSYELPYGVAIAAAAIATGGMKLAGV